MTRQVFDYIEAWVMNENGSVQIGDITKGKTFPTRMPNGYVATYFDQSGSPHQSVSGSRLRQVHVYAGDCCDWRPDRCATFESR